MKSFEQYETGNLKAASLASHPDQEAERSRSRER
jgi:hypothetical protein